MRDKYWVIITAFLVVLALVTEFFVGELGTEKTYLAPV